MKTNPRVATALALALATSFVAGCGKQPDSTDSPAAAEQAEPAAPSASAEAPVAASPDSDPLLTVAANKENVARAQEIDAYNLGVMAYPWGYPLVRMERVMRNGWNWAPLEGYGWNYPLRAVHSGPYLGGNVASEAVYPNTSVDADGNLLTGANKYELRFYQPRKEILDGTYPLPRLVKVS